MRAAILLLTWLAVYLQRRFVGEKKMLQVAMVGEAQSDRQPGL